MFYGCSNYPSCDFSLRQKPIPEPCPSCESVLVINNRSSVSCSSCDYSADIEEFQTDGSAAEVAG